MTTYRRHANAAIAALGAAITICAGPASAGAATWDFTPPSISAYAVQPTLLCLQYDEWETPPRQLTFNLSEPAKVKLTQVNVAYLPPFTIKPLGTRTAWSGLLPAGRNTLAAALNWSEGELDPKPSDTAAFGFPYQLPDSGFYVLQARDRSGNVSLPVTSGFLSSGNGGHGGVGGSNGCA